MYWSSVCCSVQPARPARDGILSSSTVRCLRVKFITKRGHCRFKMAHRLLLSPISHGYMARLGNGGGPSPGSAGCFSIWRALVFRGRKHDSAEQTRDSLPNATPGLVVIPRSLRRFSFSPNPALYGLGDGSVGRILHSHRVNVEHVHESSFLVKCSILGDRRSSWSTQPRV